MKIDWKLSLGFWAIAVVTAVAGLVHGRLTGRWGPPADLKKAAQLLEKLPDSFGNWQKIRSGNLDAYAAKMLECVGDLVRDYRNNRSGAIVQVAIMVGEPGPLAVHPPDICYAMADYEKTEKSGFITVSVDGTEHRFRWVEFRTSTAASNLVRVYYAWTFDGQWQVPENPRISLVKHKFVYKMQLSAPVVSDQTEQEVKDFLAHCLAAFAPHLVPATGGR